MSRNEYISSIEKSLVGQVTTEEIHETVQYYNDYFDMEMKKGKTEQEIMDHLGNPRLLAKTIIAASSENEKAKTIIEQEDVENGDGDNRRVFHLPFSLTIIASILLLILLIVVGITVFSLIFPFLIVFIIIFLIISGIIYLVKR